MGQGGFTVSARVQSRNQLGQFERMAMRAAEQAAREMVETTARIAAQDAPVGPPREDYARREKVSSSIDQKMVGPTVGVIGTSNVAAASQETGARPHLIPNAFGRGITVEHPGNASDSFIRTAPRKLQPLIPGILRKWFNF